MRAADARPSRADIAACLAAHPPRLTPGVTEVVAKLHERGVAVCLISGGFRLMIEPVADRLGISRERIWANSLEFDAARGFVRHDDREPTSRSGGKPAVVAELKRAPHAHACVVMVGDGGTDLEAKPPADAFIGFGGVAERGAVRDGADWFVRDFADVLAVLEEED